MLKGATSLARTGEPRVERKRVNLHRGLYLIRYESAADEAYPPSVSISSETAGDHQVAVITDPDAMYGLLTRPGDCLVVRAVERGVLRMEVAAARADGSVDAKVAVERLRNGEVAAGDAAPAPAKEPPPARSLASVLEPPAREYPRSRDLSREEPLDPSGVEIMGHVARLGDVTVALGEWLAGPAAPSRIEGLAVSWPERPRDVALNYTVEIGGKARGETQSGTDGSFAGTRGRALPLVGVTLSLKGASSAAHELVVEGLFLGSPPVRQVGGTVTLRAPTGREPLVGLKVDLRVKRSGSGTLRDQEGSEHLSNDVRVFSGRSTAARRRGAV